MKCLFSKNQIAIITILLFTLISCTNKAQQELASTDIVKELEENTSTRYIVNKHSGKVQY